MGYGIYSVWLGGGVAKTRNKKCHHPSADGRTKPPNYTNQFVRQPTDDETLLNIDFLFSDPYLSVP